MTRHEVAHICQTNQQVIPAWWVRQSKTICYWCPYCQQIHRYGDAGEGMLGGGYRVSHCFSEVSPLKGTQVYLDVIGEISDGEDLQPKQKGPKRKPSKPPHPWISIGDAVANLPVVRERKVG